ncbi:hypothetical protein NDU88_005629 [Pleurodeles waltl]|uniref:Uncharacterized protein n=1 Tax=Pleurodeles waltl TaxID=8319 RepID=A0AAV7MDI1_PLEWA|nr:hypothetical protein NDU88_005629 [Pleurodeles waltl]
MVPRGAVPEKWTPPSPTAPGSPLSPLASARQPAVITRGPCLAQASGCAKALPSGASPSHILSAALSRLLPDPPRPHPSSPALLEPSLTSLSGREFFRWAAVNTLRPPPPPRRWAHGPTHLWPHKIPVASLLQQRQHLTDLRICHDSDSKAPKERLSIKSEP